MLNKNFRSDLFHWKHRKKKWWLLSGSNHIARGQMYFFMYSPESTFCTLHTAKRSLWEMPLHYASTESKLLCKEWHDSGRLSPECGTLNFLPWASFHVSWSQLKPIKKSILMEILLAKVNTKRDVQLPLKSRHSNVYYDQAHPYALSWKKPSSSLLQLLTMQPSGHGMMMRGSPIWWY